MAQWDAPSPDVTIANSTLQFCNSVHRGRTRFNPFSKMKFGR
jgi:hypothetical protein